MKKERQYKRDQQEHKARKLNERAEAQMCGVDLNWYLGFCAPGREFIAQAILNEAGIEAYLPIVMKSRKINRYTKARRRFAFPVMPGCVFLGLERGAEHWFNLFTCQRTVKRVLGSGGLPRALSGGELKAFIDGNHVTFGQNLTGQAKQQGRVILAKGEKVQVIDGALAGHIVEIEEVKGKKATIIAELFGSPHAVQTDLDKLTKVL